MKKKLEADLMSIAHRVLQLKSKDDLRQLQLESQKLYEKLSILLFIEENFEATKPTISQAEIEEKVIAIFDIKEETTIQEIEEVTNEEKILIPTEIQEEKPEDLNTEVVKVDEVNVDSSENIASENVSFANETTIVEKSNFENIDTHLETSVVQEIENGEFAVASPVLLDDTLNVDTIEAEVAIIPEKVIDENIVTSVVQNAENEPVALPKMPEIVINNLALETFFEKAVPEKVAEKVPETDNFKFFDFPKTSEFVFEKVHSNNLNDKLKKSVDIGLNDKIAFEKNLFGGSTEDYNRVISQISTFDSFEGAKNFINTMVKPDYNDWKFQEEFANRFMEIIENRFS